MYNLISTGAMGDGVPSHPLHRRQRKVNNAPTRPCTNTARPITDSEHAARDAGGGGRGVGCEPGEGGDVGVVRVGRELGKGKERVREGGGCEATLP